MKIEKIYPKGFAANTYFVTADGKNAVVVDPAQPRIFSLLAERALAPAYVLLTHAHFEPRRGRIRAAKGGRKSSLFGRRSATYRYAGGSLRGIRRAALRFSLGRNVFGRRNQVPLRLKGDGDFDARAYRGRNVLSRFGGVENGKKTGDRALFTGDTLFEGCVGRTDFPTGDTAALRRSLKKLAAIEGDMPVYPGHDEDTTLETERKTNSLPSRRLKGCATYPTGRERRKKRDYDAATHRRG